MKNSKQKETQSIQYPKPKILLLDCEQSVSDRLSADGFNVEVGTFGRPFKVRMDEGFHPVICSADLPNYSEQEIIVIDLTPTEIASGPEADKHIAYSSNDWWCSTETGVIDPRPRVMEGAKAGLDRILRSGGIFIVFCEPRQKQKMRFATGNKYGGLERVAEEIKSDNWSFLSVFSDPYFNITMEHGSEIYQPQPNGYSTFLERHLKNCRFSTVFSPTYRFKQDACKISFESLLNNKHGDSVGGLILDSESKGVVFLLPHFSRKQEFVHDLIAHVLPDIMPQHFPFSERTRWLYATEYEHPEVISLCGNKAKILSEAAEKANAIELQIENERQRQSYLHGILTKTGDDLVKDVKLSLEDIGFRDVIDVDEIGIDANFKQEDLQVSDRNPILLIEVKGINGLPTEGDTLQVVKYIPRRMKEWGHTGVSGVVIINHQRCIPPVQRRNALVFTPQQIEDAENSDIVLVTTWELFRLLRAKKKYFWKAEFLTGMFYGKGRISSIPLHWKEVGKVAHFFEKPGVVSIELSDTLKVGDKIGFLLSSEYIEEEVTSLELDRTSVGEATAGQRVGFKTSRTRGELKEGMSFYVIQDLPRSPSD
jgi:hypothetical protein